jgi:hypothetical protein
MSARARREREVTDVEEVSRAYADWHDKGSVVNGKRLTLMAEPTSVRPGDEVRVLHVFERTQPGGWLYVMGPKTPYGEYADGRLVTEPPPAADDPLAPAEYDGETLPSPDIDTNFEVTVYSFDEPGRHEIVWELGPLRSNTLTIDVVEPDDREG